MNGKERLYAAISGKPVDRPPIWLNNGFNIGGDILDEPRPVVSKKEICSEFTQGWKLTKLYRELFEYVSPYADIINFWNIGPYINRLLMIPPEKIKREIIQTDKNIIKIKGSIETPDGLLFFQDEIRRNINTYWYVDCPVNSVEDLRSLAKVPFNFEESNIDIYVENFKKEHDKLGSNGIMCIDFPSPIIAISSTMHLENFLIMSITEKKFILELLEEITQRCLMVIDAIFKNNNLETIVCLGGSEQCTPPLMSLNAYEDFIVPFDGRLIERLKRYGIPVSIHCHGKVRNILKYMIEMGADSTDPVEPPLQGDVSIAEARNIVGQKLTLIGNLEFNELEHASIGDIKRRVHEILSTGKDRLILSSSAGPISAITPKLAENYKAWIDAVIENTI